MNHASAQSNPRQHPTRRRCGFSMVELLAAVAIMGVIAFMAIPSVIKMRGDSERNLAIARAEALNISVASFIQAVGRSRAEQEWAQKNNNTRYSDLLRPYLAFSEPSLGQFMPSGYTITFPNSVATMEKAVLRAPSGALIRY